jgi:hypothetical protein
VELFSLADKCARAAEGCAWHSRPAPEVAKDNKPNAGPPLRAVATTTRIIRRRKPMVITSRWLVPPQLQLRWQVGAKAHEVTSAPVKRPIVMTLVPGS